MQQQLTEIFLSNEIIHALFWTLVHSLWQGILLAIVSAIILFRTKKSVAALRYRLLCSGFILFNIISAITFFYEMHLTSTDSNEALPHAVTYVTNNNIAIAVTHNAGTDFFERTISFIQSGEDFIVLAWIIIIMLKCISLLTGLRAVYLLKRRQVTNAGAYWDSRLKELASKIGITKPVVLLKSAIAEIPMAAGYLKPVILFPIAAFTTLTIEEIDSILLHELAHIRRRDYLVNILQSFAEILFFFNPAVIWISSLIKDERENCCDDIAIGQVENKKVFIHALMRFQEYNTVPKYAAFFSGRKHHLFNRVKRIINNNNKTLNNMEKILLSSGIIITCFLAVAFKQVKQPSFTHTNNVIQVSKKFVSANQKDTVLPAEINNDAARNVISISMHGKQYRFTEVNGKVTELYVDNKRIPDDKINKYKPVLDSLHQQVKAVHKQTEQMKLQAKELAEQAEIMKENTVALKDQTDKQAEELHAQTETMEHEPLLMIDSITNQADYLRKQAEMISASDQLKQIVQSAQSKEQAVQMKSQAKALAVQAEVMKQQAVIMKANMDKQTQQMKIAQKRLLEQSELMEKNEQLMRKDMERTQEMEEQKAEIIKQLHESTDSTHQDK